MGFFASELGAVLSDHGKTWEWLGTLGIHPTQIQRLRDAADDIAQVASLQPNLRAQVKQDLELIPLEVAKLEAGSEADVFFRLLCYHNYPLEEAANKANAVFAAALKDHLARSEDAAGSIYPSPTATNVVQIPASSPTRHRGRRKASEIAAAAAADELAQKRGQKAAANA